MAKKETIKNPIHLGERQLKLVINDVTVSFDSSSTIQFYDDEDQLLLQMDPTELSAIYGAYMQMCQEENKD